MALSLTVIRLTCHRSEARVADVRVGIVSWNTADLLDRCLAALPAALDGLDAEIVVVDNSSGDGSADVTRSHPSATLIVNSENLGYARAMNQALSGSTAPVLVALNPDTRPPPGSLAALVERLDAHPEAAILVPRLLNTDGSLQHSVYRFPSVRLTAAVSFVPRRLQRGRLGRRLWLEGFAPHDESCEIDWAIGAVHVIRAAVVDPDCVYSERWFMYVEDIELCWRVRQEGWTVRLEPEVKVPHVGNAAGAQAWGAHRARRYWEATYDFYREAHGPLATRCFAAVNTIGSGLHFAVNGAAALAPGPRRAHRRSVARDLGRVVPVHGRAVVTRPVWKPS